MQETITNNSQDILTMDNQEKGTAGRKKLPAGEKKQMIRVFIKAKNAAKARKEIKAIEEKYAD